MAETFKIIFILFLNLVLIAVGPIVIKRQHVSIGIGRPRPIITITLAGTGATIFGIASIVGGIVAFIPTLAFFFSRDDAMLETALTIGMAIALIVMATGFVVGGLIQSLLIFQKGFAGKDKKVKRDS
jgi:hypothetical protein